MKKNYTGLDAVMLPVDANVQTMFASTPCFPIYTTHFDTNNDIICDSQENLPGATDVATQSWNSCPDNDVE